MLITPMNAEADRNLEHSLIHFFASLPENFRLDSIDDARVHERAKITELIALTSNNLAHDTAHDLNNPLNRCLMARTNEAKSDLILSGSREL